MTDAGTSPPFTPGLTLSRHYFEEAVRPLLSARFPRLEYAAALIGPGSEVLGFDTRVSTDHHWGPRVMLFLSEADLTVLNGEIDDWLSRELPYTFHGYSTNFGPPDEIGVRLPQFVSAGPVAHRVETTTVAEWFASYLGWDTQDEPTTVAWLSYPQHRLRATSAGAIFLDDLGDLTNARARLDWYPHDIWLYMLAAQWNRVAQEEAFMARCGDVGDELGSSLVAARIVSDLVRLCFLMERVYAPYAKWLGSAFRQLSCGKILESRLSQSIHGATWQDRESALSVAYEAVARSHNALGITARLDPHVRRYHGRPYLVISAERFAAAIEARIEDEQVRRLPRHVGSLNQLIDASDTLESAEIRARIGRVYN